MSIKTFALARSRLFRKKPRTVNIPTAEQELTGKDKNYQLFLGKLSTRKKFLWLEAAPVVSLWGSLSEYSIKIWPTPSIWLKNRIIDNSLDLITIKHAISFHAFVIAIKIKQIWPINIGHEERYWLTFLQRFTVLILPARVRYKIILVIY